MFGYVGYMKNEPFLMLESDYIDGAFAGMLSWELEMPRELNPIFPTGEYGAPETETESRRLLFEREASTTAAITPTNPTGLSPFEDITIASLPSRILRTSEQQTVLAWTMSGNYILITTNEEALRRVIERLQSQTL